MLICLEGVDLGGKSTLARQLVEHHGSHRSEIIHQGVPRGNVDLVELYERPLLEKSLQERALDPDHLVVLDRWEVGELIYGPLWRGRSRLTMGQATHIDLLLRSLGAVRILAQPEDPAVVLERYDQRGDDLLAREHVIQVFEAYELHAQRQPGWVRASDGDPDTFLVMAEEGTLQGLELTPFPGYVGRRYPTILYVGERRANTRTGEPLPWTDKAFTPVGGLGCSRWLLDALWHTGTLNIGLVNAYEPDLDLKSLWQVLWEPAVIALGNLAAEELARVGVPFNKVYHPQYARRFMHSRFEDYAWELHDRGVEEVRRKRDGAVV